ncbi:hypothetical protein [Bremerella alba]|uniref:Uncharacterized protein n=1 Tax=Bremerella alba TaxID=980252 RepID=A0A7V9A5W6_9BACT|nr:hypothetical protein [Bremerella alba]MBA2113663.1 hypothetical protein [Bremerella alba]
MNQKNELLELLFGAPLVVSKSADKCIVSGFASTADIDLSGHLVDVSSFTWDGLPQLLEQHQGDPIGQIMTLNKAFLSDIGDIDNWGVFDSESGEQINTYPKKDAPEFRNGSLGLFVTAEVTKPEVIEKVKSGLFGGFSWRGLTLAVKDFLGMAKQYLTDIELWEVSLVTVPANPNAKFVVAKSAEDKNAIFDDIFPSCEVTEEVQKEADTPEDAHPELANMFPPCFR